MMRTGRYCRRHVSAALSKACPPKVWLDASPRKAVRDSFDRPAHLPADCIFSNIVTALRAGVLYIVSSSMQISRF
jgi:hypothetical protein